MENDKKEIEESRKKKREWKAKDLCAETGKVAHKTYYDAAQQLRRLGKEKDDGIETMNIYQCPYCGHYHVGHFDPALAWRDDAETRYKGGLPPPTGRDDMLQQD
jgi:hypothetical protein